MRRPLIALILPAVLLQALSPAQEVERILFPDRAAFAAHERELGQVPVSAFQLGGPNAGNLKIEVWAQSPLIFSPVAMDVDPQGRIWATEGIDYHCGQRVKAGQSIVVLTDSDNDGKADKSHVFVTESGARQAPLGIAVFDNRIVLSATPSITVYTDVDRNAVFDPAIDKKEIFLTGFQNKQHDHTLHAVVGSPSGQWYFSYGNCGADIRTKDGRHFLSGCYYGYPEAIGKPSSDGHLYVGGLAMRINPDGTGLTPVGENLRNTHDMFVTSMGDVLHSDNDDPAHCRSTWLMEHGNMGYTDLRDGSRSWEEVSKTWEEPKEWTRDLRYSKSHWRQNYPGSLPPGTIYGAGSPTGNVFIEGDELGRKMRGLYLVCDMVRKEVMGCFPQAVDAQIEMGKHHPFVGLGDGEQGRFFLPTDVVVGIDGSLYFSDFYNDTSRRTNQVTGTIYRISNPDAAKSRAKIVTDFDSDAGLLAALKSPAVNVRAEAVRRMISRGEILVPELIRMVKIEENPFYRARAIWVLAQLGPKGQDYVGSLLKSDLGVVAWRALRLVDPGKVLGRGYVLAREDSAAIRREVALSLRDASYRECHKILIKLFEGYDGANRWYLEALGVAATNKEKETYLGIVRPMVATTAHSEWNATAKNLAWRLHTPEAIEDLHKVIQAQKPKLDEFRHLVMAYASFRNDAERLDRRTKLMELAALPEFASEDYQLTVREILAKDLNDLKGEGLEASFTIPTSFGAKTRLSTTDKIAALKGDAGRGRLKAQSCLVCHRIQGAGVAFGPELSRWGQQRTVAEVVAEMVDPSAKLAHGYEKPVRLRRGQHVAEGILLNYSHHAGSLRIKLFGGEIRKILFRRRGVKVENLKDHSWMPPASEMGLEDQDVRDIAEYLRGL